MNNKYAIKSVEFGEWDTISRIEFDGVSVSGEQLAVLVDEFETTRRQLKYEHTRSTVQVTAPATIDKDAFLKS